MSTLARSIDIATDQTNSTSRLTPEKTTMKRRKATDPSPPDPMCPRPICAIPEDEQAPRVTITPALVPRARSKALARKCREAIEVYLAACRARYDALDVCSRAHNAGSTYQEQTRLERLEWDAGDHMQECLNKLHNLIGKLTGPRDDFEDHAAGVLYKGRVFLGLGWSETAEISAESCLLIFDFDRIVCVDE
jgi:hypothetical protein